MIDAFMGIWWLWIAVALIFGLIELFAPGFIFLGFTLGALATGLIVGLAGAPSAPALLAIPVVLLAGTLLARRRQAVRERDPVTCSAGSGCASCSAASRRTRGSSRATSTIPDASHSPFVRPFRRKTP